MSQSSSEHLVGLTIEQRELAFALERRELDLVRRENEVSHERRRLEHERRDLDLEHKKRNFDFEQKQQKRETELTNQQQRLDLEQQELGVKQQELEMKQQAFEAYKKDVQLQLKSLSEQHRMINPDSHDPLGLPTKIPSDDFQPHVVLQDQVDAKLAEIETGKRQLKKLSRAFLSAEDALYQMREDFNREYVVKIARLEAERASLEAQSERFVEEQAQSRADMEAESLALKQSYEDQIQTLKDAAEIADQGLLRLTDVDPKKFALIREGIDRAQSILDIPNQQFLSTLETIDACNKNSKHYGASKTQVQIEFRCEQLSKQLHLNTTHYVDLLRLIFDTGDRKHINPHDSKVTLTYDPILSSYWKSDTDSGKAPKLTPDLKVFFSSPNINNGDWVQFHGPGTILYQLDPGFKLTVGSLCDPDGKGSFTSIHCKDPGILPATNGTTKTSPYQIKFKWE